jgi:hypothetical protein
MVASADQAQGITDDREVADGISLNQLRDEQPIAQRALLFCIQPQQRGAQGRLVGGRQAGAGGERQIYLYQFMQMRLFAVFDR